jgi:hypothetical protein
MATNYQLLKQCRSISRHQHSSSRPAHTFYIAKLVVNSNPEHPPKTHSKYKTSRTRTAASECSAPSSFKIKESTSTLLREVHPNLNLLGEFDTLNSSLAKPTRLR